MDIHKELSNSNYVLFHQHFDNFDEFATTVHAWDLDFQQLDRGRSTTILSQAIGTDVVFSHARITRHYHQLGNTPAGMRTFALLEDNVSGIHWFGREVTNSALMCFPANQELEAVSRPDFEVYTISFSETLLAKIAHQCGLPGLETILCDDEKLANCTARDIFSIRSVFRKLKFLLQQQNTDTILLINTLEEELPELILKALSGALDIPLARTTQWKKQRALTRATEFIHEKVNEPISVAELSHYTNVSIRTLEEAFKEYYGITPKKYLKATRLNGVHKELRNTDLPITSITDVANKWGFWHMGQFAADYKSLFEELPSITLRARK